MRFLKKNKGKLLLLLCLLLILSGCGEEQELPQATESEGAQPQLKVTAMDRDTTGTNPVRIDLEEQRDSLQISQGGTYLLTGNLKGSIHINAEEQIVHVILQDAEVDSHQGPALYVHSAGKVILSLTEGSENTLQDSSIYGDTEEADACIYSENDLTINGTGTLNIYGYYQDAVHTKDVLKILDGKLFVQSKRDGLRGNDGILLSCEEITVQSERNGLRTTKTGKPGKGNIEILAGEHSVIGGNYAISCAQDMYVQNCELFLLGVVGFYEADGEQYIQKGCLVYG